MASSTRRHAVAENAATTADPQLALATAITQAVSQSLQPLLASKEAKNKPNKYKGEKDGLIDTWLTIMKRYLEKAHRNDSPADRAWTIIEFLESEARDYIINKSEPERDTDEKVLRLLTRRFGVGSNRTHIQQQFRTRNQTPEESHMQFLDALEGLRSQGFPLEPEATRRYEILQRFTEGVRNQDLRRYLAGHYADEHLVDDPPTVEALRYTVQHYLRARGSYRPKQQGAGHTIIDPRINKTKTNPRVTHKGTRSKLQHHSNRRLLQCRSASSYNFAQRRVAATTVVTTATLPPIVP